MISAYQHEQIETITMVCRHLSALPTSERRKLQSSIQKYLAFREETHDYLTRYFGSVCSQKCYQSDLSACCSREGIITFFTDILINALQSRDSEIENLLLVLQKPNTGSKCVYLGPEGCLWQVKPIVCEMFLCDFAKKRVFAKQPEAEALLNQLNRRKKTFTWPDQPVLFDHLESYFLDAGLSSPLMYLHNSPGLLRVKKMAGIKSRNLSKIC